MMAITVFLEQGLPAHIQKVYLNEFHKDKNSATYITGHSVRCKKG